MSYLPYYGVPQSQKNNKSCAKNKQGLLDRVKKTAKARNPHG